MNERLIEMLKKDEGFKGSPYLDSLGKMTIGYGTLLPIDEIEAELLLIHRLNLVQSELEIRIDFFESLPENIKIALTNMAYQLGVRGVLNFKNMLNALKNGDYQLAYEEALNSKWAKQTPNRAKRTAGLFLKSI